jgi:hypothetical protein
VRRGAFSLRLRPAREDFVIVESVWIGTKVHALPPHSPWWDTGCIPPGADAFTRARRKRQSRSAGCGRLGRGRLDGRAIRRATLRVPARLVLLCFGPPRDSSRGLYRLPRGSHFGPVFSAPALSETRTAGGYRDACSIARSLRGLLDACSIPRQGHPPGCASSGAAGRPRAASRAPRPSGRGAQTGLQAGLKGAPSTKTCRASEGTAKEPPLCQTHR